MTKHTCKNCNRIFEYCRGCLLSPIPHMDAGFCSKNCYEASKIKVEPVVEEVMEVISEDTKPLDEIVPVAVETEAIAEENISTEIEITPSVVEPTIKKETYNTYKKKKNKYK